MKNKLTITTSLLTVTLCACTKEQPINVATGVNNPTTNESAMVINYIDKSVFDRMVGQQVKLAGSLVYAGKGNYHLQTTNGLVFMGYSLGITEEVAESSTNIVVEGVLNFAQARSIPKDIDPSSIQSNFRPGQYIPEHFWLYPVKLISVD